MTVYVGIDDTDNLETRGTGHLARDIAAALSEAYQVKGVVRHQLLIDERVPCTKNNSCASILLDTPVGVDLNEIIDRVRSIMVADFQTGSDPGLCVTHLVPEQITEFGRKAQSVLVTQQAARKIAAEFGIFLEGLGGTESGVIGALAAVGLAASGEDGRYVLVGRIRDLTGLQQIETLLAAGVNSIRTTDGRIIHQGVVQTDKLRPARRGGQPVVIVDWKDSFWQPLKLN